MQLLWPLVSLVGPKGLLANEFSRAKGSLPQDRLR